MDTYAQSNKYHCTIETVQETVDKYGVAVVTSVLDSSACTELANDLWHYLEHITQNWNIPICRTDPSTWRQIYDLIPSHSMLMQHFEIGHSPAAWKVRQNSAVVDVFAELYKCSRNDMLASFDGAAICLPPEITGRGWQPPPNKHWFHVDQSFARNEFECYQGWVTAHDVAMGDATLSVLEGSHHLHGKFAETFYPNKTAPPGDWHKLKDDELSFFLARCSEVRISCPAGSVVVWDSRTVHQGGQPLRSRPMARERAVVYVCYQPITMLPAKQRTRAIQKKRRAFLDKRMTSHWPLKSKLFGKIPQHYGKGIPSITPIVKAIGLEWEKMAEDHVPSGKIQLKNEKLTAALSSKLEFTPDEWKAIGVKDLTHDHVVKVGEDYLKPVDDTLELTTLGRTLAGFA